MLEKCLGADALKDIFVLTYDRMRRYQGAWHMEKHLLFPAYIFLESREETDAEEKPELCRISAEILGTEEEIISLNGEEERFLKSLCGKTHHFGMSKGYIKGGRTYVTEGPLQGKEEMIRKIDRHKRLARVELPGTAELREMCVGLEIVAKMG